MTSGGGAAGGSIKPSGLRALRTKATLDGDDGAHVLLNPPAIGDRSAGPGDPDADAAERPSAGTGMDGKKGFGSGPVTGLLPRLDRVSRSTRLYSGSARSSETVGAWQPQRVEAARYQYRCG